MKSLASYTLVSLILLLTINDVFSLDRSKNTAGYVSGRVLDERNFPVPFAKVIIKGNETQTDDLGKFRILNIAYPYDAVVADRSTSTAIIYKNLSIDNPDLILFGKANPRNANSAIINVNFPEIPNGSSAIIKFISTDVFYCEDIEVFPGEKNKTLVVYWPARKRDLNGDVIFLQKNSTSYEGYRNVKASLFKNPIPFEVSFRQGGIYTTRTSDLTIYLPFKDYKSKGYSVFADFFGYDRNSEISLTREEGNFFRTQSIIPLELPISYRIKVSGFVDYNDGSGFANSVYSKPGDVINLKTEVPPELETPSDKYLGASGETEFYYSLGSGTGIYVVQYHSYFPVMNFYVVTGERSAYLNYLSREEFKRASSVEFKWNVKKYLTYFSVDDFVKPKEFRNDVGYKAVLYSGERTFKTGYF